MNTPSALTLQWHARETERFASGTYKPIPVNLDYPASHFAHLSTTETEADYVAYTPSDQYGQVTNGCLGWTKAGAFIAPSDR